MDVTAAPTPAQAECPSALLDGDHDARGDEPDRAGRRGRRGSSSGPASAQAAHQDGVPAERSWAVVRAPRLSRMPKPVVSECRKTMPTMSEQLVVLAEEVDELRHRVLVVVRGQDQRDFEAARARRCPRRAGCPRRRPCWATARCRSGLAQAPRAAGSCRPGAGRAPAPPARRRPTAAPRGCCTSAPRRRPTRSRPASRSESGPNRDEDQRRRSTIRSIHIQRFTARILHDCPSLCPIIGHQGAWPGVSPRRRSPARS